MGTTNTMGWDIQWDFKQDLKSDKLSEQLFDVIKPGVVSGFDVVRYSANAIQINPGVVWAKGEGSAQVFRCMATSPYIMGVPVKTGDKLVLNYKYEFIADNYPNFGITSIPEDGDVVLAFIVWGKDAGGNDIIVSVDNNVKQFLPTNVAIENSLILRASINYASSVIHTNPGRVLFSGKILEFAAFDTPVDMFISNTGDFRMVVIYFDGTGVHLKYGDVNNASLPATLGGIPVAAVKQHAGVAVLYDNDLKDLRTPYLVDTSFPINDTGLPSTTHLLSSKKTMEEINYRKNFQRDLLYFPSFDPIVGGGYRMAASGSVPALGTITQDVQVSTPTFKVLLRTPALVASRRVLAGFAWEYKLPLSASVAGDFGLAVRVNYVSGGETVPMSGFTQRDVSLTTAVNSFVGFVYLNDNFDLPIGAEIELEIDIAYKVQAATVLLTVGHSLYLADFYMGVENRAALVYNPELDLSRSAVPLQVQDTAPIKGLDDLANDPNKLLSSRKIFELLNSKADALSANVLRGTAPLAGGYYGLTLGTPTSITISNTFPGTGAAWVIKFKSNPFPTQRTIKAGLPIFIKLPVSLGSPTPTQFQFVLTPILIKADASEVVLASSTVTEEVYQAGRTDVSANAVVTADVVGAEGDSIGFSVSVTRVSGTGNITLNLFIGDAASQLYINFQTAVAAVQGYNYDSADDSINLSAKTLNVVSPIDGSKFSVVDGILGYPTFDPAKTEGYKKGDLLWLVPPDLGVIDTGSRVYPYIIPASPTSFMGKEHFYIYRTQLRRLPVLLRSNKDNNTDNFVENQMYVGMSWDIAQPYDVCEFGFNAGGAYRKYAGSVAYAEDMYVSVPGTPGVTFPIKLLRSFVVNVNVNIKSTAAEIWVARVDPAFISDVGAGFFRTSQKGSVTAPTNATFLADFRGEWYNSDEIPTYFEYPVGGNIPAGTYYFRTFEGKVDFTGDLSSTASRLRVWKLGERNVYAWRMSVGSPATNIYNDATAENLVLDIPNKNYYGFYLGVVPPPFMGATLVEERTSVVTGSIYYYGLNGGKSSTTGLGTNLFRVCEAPDGTKYTALSASSSPGLDRALAKYDPEWNPSAGKYWGFSTTPW